MISFRTVDGSTFIRIDDAIAYEEKRYRSSLAKRRRGKGSPMVFGAIRDNLKTLKRYKTTNFIKVELCNTSF